MWRIRAPDDFHLALGRLEAFDYDGDAGIDNVGTLGRARRRGLGSAVVGALLRDAVARGARTATLQSTAMARGVYARPGFRDLGRIIELAPPPPRP